MRNSRRLSYIDTAKCIAIFCIVMGHTHWMAREFLYSFHVQMFFILVGFVFTQKHNSIREYLQIGLPKLIKRIYIPYILLILIFNVQLNAENLPWILWGSDQTVMHGKQFSFMWFLPTYFSAVLIWNILTILLSKYKYPQYTMFIIVTLLGIFSCLTKNNSDLSIELFNRRFYLTGYQQVAPPYCSYIGFPMNLNVAGTAIVFIYSGTLLCKVFEYLKIVQRRNAAIAGILVFGTIGVFSYIINATYYKPVESYPWIIGMSFGSYGNYVLFLLSAIATSISTICLATLIDCILLAKIGKNTFGIYSLHPFVRNIIVFLLGGSSISIMYSWIGGIIMFAGTLLFLPFVKRWFPFVIGE